jgi:hypothetical protein
VSKKHPEKSGMHGSGRGAMHSPWTLHSPEQHCPCDQHETLSIAHPGLSGPSQ